MENSKCCNVPLVDCGAFLNAAKCPKCHKLYDTQSPMEPPIKKPGEVQAALGKSVKWGMKSYNPELPEDQREYNFQWILKELKDLKRAIRFVEKFIKENY